MLHAVTVALSAQLWVLALRRLLAVLLPLSVIVALEHLRHILSYIFLRIAARHGARALDPTTHHPLPKVCVAGCSSMVHTACITGG